jgi:hypothetical protein
LILDGPSVSQKKSKQQQPKVCPSTLGANTFFSPVENHPIGHFSKRNHLNI